MLVIDVAPSAIERVIVGDGRADHLVIGEHAGHALGIGKGGAGDLRIRTVGADDAARANYLLRAAAFIDDHHESRPVRVAIDSLERGGAALGPGLLGTGAEPLVIVVAVDHADEPVNNGHVDRSVRRRDHAGKRGATDDEVVGNGEVGDQARRNGAAARLHPTAAVDQQH